MIKFSFLISIIFFFSGFHSLFAQSDWVRWEKVDKLLLINSYGLYSQDNSKIADDNKSIANILLKIYKTTFSDYDGDNCSFNPSCSEFFAESSKLTNIFGATLLFFDRLTRDSNIFSKGGYKIVNNRFFDPPSDYIFEETKSIR